MKTIGFIILSLLFISGCKNNPNNPTTSPVNEYFPMHTGDTWRYIQFDGKDTMDYLDVKVVGTTYLNGKNYFQVSYKYDSFVKNRDNNLIKNSNNMNK